MNKHRIKICFTIAVLLLIVTFFMSLCKGSANISLAKLWPAILEGPKHTTTAVSRIFWYARFPRTMACMLAGAALAVSGAVIQGVLTNQLASPGIIGVNAGAGFAVTICCALGAFSGWAIAGAAFGGAVAAVLLVAFTAQKIGASRTTVILGGVAVNSCLNAASEAVAILIPDAGMQAADFRVGGFSSVAYGRLLPAGTIILIGLIVLFTLTNELDVISLGEDTAQGLGMPVKKMRTVFLTISALLAGAAVSFAGLLGFVGLIIPHIGRKLVTYENGKLLPFCAICGAAFVTFCDMLARTMFSPYEIPVGIFLSFLGGPFFLFLLINKKRRAYLMIVLENMSAGYEGKNMIENVTMTLEPGKITVLLGPNGCGKSTLLKTIVRIIPHSGGKLWVNGKNVEAFGTSELARTVAYLAQNKKAPDISVLKMVLHGRFAHLNYPRKYRPKDYEIAKKALQWAGLEHLEHVRVSKLSGGMQQKVYIAMALAQDADTILMDEPTTYLDVAHQLRLMDMVKELAKEGKAVVMVLHDLDQALQIADRIVLLKEGRVIAQGTAAEIYESKSLEQAFEVQVERVQAKDGWHYVCSLGEEIR